VEGGFTGTNKSWHLSENLRNLLFTFALIISILLMGVVGYKNWTLQLSSSTENVKISTNQDESVRELYLLKLIKRGILSDREAMFWKEVTEENE